MQWLMSTHVCAGEEADVASGLAEPSFNPMETAIQAREQVNNLMERYASHLIEACLLNTLPFC